MQQISEMNKERQRMKYEQRI